jgi:hypothetical protein
MYLNDFLGVLSIFFTLYCCDKHFFILHLPNVLIKITPKSYHYA